MPSVLRNRIDIRLRPEQKRSIEHAADLKGLTITDFIVQNAVENANRTIAEHEAWVLRGADAAAFMEALLNPPTPNAYIQAAAEKYKSHFSVT